MKKFIGILFSFFLIIVLSSNVWTYSPYEWEYLTDKDGNCITVPVRSSLSFFYATKDEIYDLHTGKVYDYEGRLLRTLEKDDMDNFTYPAPQMTTSKLKPIKNSDGKYGYCNEDGDTVIEFQWDFASTFSEGLAHVKKDNLTYIINESGEITGKTDEEILIAFNFREGLMAAEIYGAPNGHDRGVGFVNRNGEEVIPYSYRNAFHFSSGLSAVEDGITGEWYYINYNGEKVISAPNEESWVYAGNFVNGVAFVTVKNYKGEYSTNIVKLVNYSPSMVSLVVFGDPVVCTAPAFIRDSRTMVPVRFISEKLGNKVDWDEAEKTVTITSQNGKILTVRVGETSIYLDGKEIKMDTPAIIENGRTYVPVKFIANALGMKITWYEKTKTIYID